MEMRGLRNFPPGKAIARTNFKPCLGLNPGRRSTAKSGDIFFKMILIATACNRPALRFEPKALFDFFNRLLAADGIAFCPMAFSCRLNSQ